MSIQTKIVIYLTLVIWALYDWLAARLGWLSISAGMRYLDIDSGGMVRWIWFGLGAHFFFQIPWGGWSN